MFANRRQIMRPGIRAHVCDLRDGQLFAQNKVLLAHLFDNLQLALVHPGVRGSI